MFHNARKQLTLWYVLGIMIISVFFSIGIYRIQIIELQRFEMRKSLRLEMMLDNAPNYPLRDKPGRMMMADPELIEEAKSRLLYGLLIVNTMIALIATGVGYILAGKTLTPISNMIDAQEAFVANASHELKTPLAALKSGFEVYLRDDARTRRDADTVITESLVDIDRISYLSDSLLTNARAQNATKLIQDTIFTKELIQIAVDSLKSIAKSRKIDVLIHTDDSQVKVDRESMIKALTALLDNAIKYSEEGQTIKITAKKHKSNIIIDITDQGIGISKKDVPHIFDRFYRADTSRSRATGGYGLGLSIVKSIIQAHGGEISVESKLHEGSRFIISLPA